MFYHRNKKDACEHKDLSSIPQNLCLKKKMLEAIARTYNPRTTEAEAGGFLGLISEPA